MPVYTNLIAEVINKPWLKATALNKQAAKVPWRSSWGAHAAASPGQFYGTLLTGLLIKLDSSSTAPELSDCQARKDVDGRCKFMAAEPCTSAEILLPRLVPRGSSSGDKFCSLLTISDLGIIFG